jgi:acyl-coenzyme A thioesterase PaaI-like protein
VTADPEPAPDPDAPRPLPRFNSGPSFSARLVSSMEETSTPEEIAARRPVVTSDVPLVGGVLDHLGAYRLGPLAAVVDGVGGLCGGLAVLPRWVVTSELTLRTVAEARVGPLHCEARILRAGRASVVAEVTVVDRGADDLAVAIGVVTSAALEPAGGPPHWERPVVLRDRRAHPVPDADVPLLEWAGARPRRGGGVEIDLGPELLNPWGILYGGATTTLVDEAAARAVADVTGRPAVATSMSLGFLAPGRAGPITAVGRLVGGMAEGREAVVRVEVRDAGADRLLSVALVTVRP